MPRPFNREGPVTFHSRAVLDRPECAKMLAAVVAGWSSAEAMLAWHYQMLCGEVDLACDAGMGPGPAASVSGESFDLIPSMAQKVRILKAAVARRHFPESTVEEVEKLLRKLHKAGDERIVAAHGRWGICQNLPNELIWAKTYEGFDDMMIYEPKDFEAALDRIDKRAGAFASFFASSIVPKLKSDAEGVLNRLVAAKKAAKG
jgi:hypothetical protein